MDRPNRTRGVIVLFVLLVIAAAGTVVQNIRFDRAAAAERASAAAQDRSFEIALNALSDWRTSQAGYVAAGQGPATWMARVADLAATLTGALDRFTATSNTPAATAHYAAANAALADLIKLDGRAKSFVKTDQPFLASDVIFMDSATTVERATNELLAARDAERAASEAHLVATDRFRLAMNTGCLIAVILASAVMLRATLVWMSTAGRPVPAPLASATAPKPVATVAATTSPAEVNLSDAAELCLDLARVLDARDVGALFDRAALVLEAKGLVLWSADTSGALLRPTLTHGYPEKVVARMGGLQVDGDNATALAFRTLQAQLVVGQTPTTPGAIAVPLITASGCVGVLSAETKRHRPGSDTVSVAKMIAAQLSALVAPGGEAAAKAAQ